MVMTGVLARTSAQAKLCQFDATMRHDGKIVAPFFGFDVRLEFGGDLLSR